MQIICARLGITDSKEYLKKAKEDLNEKIEHISISIEAKIPKISTKVEEMRNSISDILEIEKNKVGITATSGEGLTACGCGEGISVVCILTVDKI